MLTTRELREKVFKLPEDFEKFYASDNFSQAKACYDTAITIATFAELSTDDQKKLFGGRSFGSEETGLFDEKKVQKAYYETFHRKK